MTHRSKGVVQYVLAGADQAVLSVVSLCAAVALMKYGSKDQFAHYAIAVSISLLVLRVQNALIVVPITVRLPAMHEDDHKAILATAQGWQTNLALILAVVSTIGWKVTELSSLGANAGWGASLGFGLMLGGALLREYCRCVEYARFRVLRALLIDGTYAIATLTAIGWLSVAGRLTLSSTLLSLGVASVIAGIVGMPVPLKLPALKGGLQLAKFVKIVATVGDMGRQGGWTLAAEAPSWVQAYAYVYLSVALIGSAATADLAASRVAMVPMFFVLTAWPKIFVPQAVRNLQSHGTRRLERLGRLNVGIAAVFAILYGLALLAMGNTSLRSLIPASYVGAFGSYTGLWAFCGLLLACRTVIWYLLIVVRDFKGLFIAASYGAIVTVVGSCFLIWYSGAAGALYALSTGEALVLVVCAVRFRRALAARAVLVDGAPGELLNVASS